MPFVDLAGGHRLTVLALASCFWLAVFPAPSAYAGNPDVLWQIVHGQCVPDEQQRNDPHPCAAVDLSGGEARGYAVLKDIRGAAQILLIPTAKVAGIESPLLLEADAPNYWEAAWQARHLMPSVRGRAIPDEDLILAINSVQGRSQNQLHIHVDCVRADVKQALADHRAEITGSWSEFPVPLAGQTYRVLRLPYPDFIGHDLFKLLAESSPAAKQDMADHTLAAMPMTFSGGQQGFAVLDDAASLTRGDRGSAERLQDHDCELVR